MVLHRVPEGVEVKMDAKRVVLDSAVEKATRMPMKKARQPVEFDFEIGY